MSSSRFSIARRLGVLIGILMLIQSAAGVFVQGVYREREVLALATFVGNDLVTLVVGVPMILGALIYSGHGSQRARLLLIGMLHYALYNNAFYVLGATFNGLFLVYVALLALSILALIHALSGLDVRAIAASFRLRTPVR